MDEERKLIEVKNLTFAYDVEPIIEDAGFSIYKNDVITILGPNGGGKTTLLKLLMGLLKPQRGTITIHGDTPNLFGYVPQHSNLDSAYPITVNEVVLSGRIKSLGFYSRRDRSEAEKSLDDVGLFHLKDRPFFELSGGQQQRVLIARAHASDPEILVLDEPTANIDADAEKNLTKLLSRLSADHTIILVTHDLGFVNDMTRRVLCVSRQVKEHPVDEVDEDLITAAYGRQMKVVRHDHEVGNTY
jgi:zinc transport system ATP-binding protein